MSSDSRPTYRSAGCVHRADCTGGLPESNLITRIDVAVRQQVHRMRTDVTDGEKDAAQHLVLEREVPRLYVTAVNVSPRAAFAGVPGKRYDTSGGLRQRDRRNAVSQRTGIGEAVGRLRLGIDGQRIETA